MWKRWKKKLSSLLIITLIASLCIPQLSVIADTADVFVGDNGTIYDADYEPFIYDEDGWDYDEEEDLDGDEDEVAVLAYYDDATPSNATPSNASLASNSNGDLATDSNAMKFPETIVFTDAAPFLPAVNVRGSRRMAASTFSLNTENVSEDNGLELSKMAVRDGDNYKITLEAYTTGTVTSIEKTTPVDIVIVLDQSGSMSKDFEGNTTYDPSKSRQYAMKTAVKNFIRSVNEKYSDSSDHRIALVRFSNSGSTIAGLTAVDENGVDTLSNAVDDLTASGDTYIGNGLEKAYELMVSDYSYTGVNNERQKVVVVFTDGMPAPNGTDDFNVSMANDGIENAKLLKDNQVTVYSVGIFNGANPEQLYGDEDSDANYDPFSDGTINSLWRHETKATADIPAGNRLLNFISNNFETADNIGIIQNDETTGNWFWEETNYGWEITENFDRTDTGYYLTADDAESLDDVFSSISENISTSNEAVNETSVIKDVVTEYFDMPENVSDIGIYTSDYLGNGVFDQRVNNSSIIPVIEGNTITVNGFDYYANFVSENGRSESGTTDDNSFKGRKLIIEFIVTAKDEFLGGNNIPTNGTDSGLYLTGEDSEAFENFAVPTVNVPIPDFTVIPADKNVYLTGTLTETDLTNEARIIVNGDEEHPLTFDEDGNIMDSSNYWDASGVEIKAFDTENCNMNHEHNTDVIGVKQLEDGTYTICATISPRENADEISSGEPAEAETAANENGQIHVYQPVVTFKDATVYYGDNVPTTNYLKDNCFVDIKWKHGDELLNDSTIMIGSEPEVIVSEYILNPDNPYSANGKITKNEDFPVVAKTITINGESEVEYTKENGTIIPLISKTFFAWEKCETDTEREEILKQKGHFLLHVKSCDLTITKTGGASDETYIFYVVSPENAVESMKMTVRITGNNSITIRDLPVGTYTVTEDENWSWRYSSLWENGNEVILSGTNPSDSVTCKNKKENDQWLNHLSTVWKNVFGESTGQGVSGNE